jgi:hypothetical protein
VARPHVADVRWVPSHHGVARPQVADEGDGHQTWRVAANTVKKQSRRADKGWFSILGIGRGANNLPNKISVLQKSQEASYLDGFF